MQTRRRWYLSWVLDHFGSLPLTDRDGRAWSLNHARLALGQDLEEANRYFCSAQLTRDRDFAAIRLLKTYLDFAGSTRLGRSARKHLRRMLTSWEMDDTYRKARWPARHTENHDLMFMTIGLFADLLRGQDHRPLQREIARSLSWRFEYGWIEWNSPRYQMHYLNPLLVLAEHAPSPLLRRGARDLINLQLAERALLSVRGYLGGPFLRGWDRHPLYDDEGRPIQRGACAYFDNNRYDAYLPAMWLAFGLAEPYFSYEGVQGLEPAGEGYGCRGDARLNQDEGMFMAASSFEPHPVVTALAAEASCRAQLIYRGTRPKGFPPDPLWAGQWPHLLYYYNTPHICMGSLQSFGWSHQTRYCNVMFAADPAMNLRVDLVLPGMKWDRWRHERRGELVQHKNWLLARGKLVRDGGIKPRPKGPWSLYRVGRGLAAHLALDGDYQLIQVSDLDLWPSEAAFLAALTLPRSDGPLVHGRTTDGDVVTVDVRDMSLRVNGRPRPSWEDRLHDSEPMAAAWGSGVVEIHTQSGDLALGQEALLRLIEEK